MVMSVRLCAESPVAVNKAMALATWVARKARRSDLRGRDEKMGEKNAMTFFLQRYGRSAGSERHAAETGRRSFD
jgi:hypothetical protein